MRNHCIIIGNVVGTVTRTLFSTGAPAPRHDAQPHHLEHTIFNNFVHFIRWTNIPTWYDLWKPNWEANAGAIQHATQKEVLNYFMQMAHLCQRTCHSLPS